MKKPMTLEDYYEARLVVDPFGMFDCSLNSDGAGAVVVTSTERARSLKQKPVLIKGFATHNNTKGWIEEDHMLSTGAVESGERAFKMAGLGPKDVDTAQIYDCFTYMVLTQLEDYGFCKKGEGGAFVRSGALRLGGALPTNTSGGQLSEAHVEGMLQIVEGARQLQGVYGPDRQVPDAEIALDQRPRRQPGLPLDADPRKGVMHVGVQEADPGAVDGIAAVLGRLARAEADDAALRRLQAATGFRRRCFARAATRRTGPGRKTSGRGRIFSYVVYHRVYHPAFAQEVPYAVAVIELDEGPRMYQQRDRHRRPTSSSAT